MLTRNRSVLVAAIVVVAALLGQPSRAAAPIVAEYQGSGGLAFGSPTVYVQVDGIGRDGLGGSTVVVRASSGAKVEVRDRSGLPVAMRVSSFATKFDRGFVLTVCDTTSFKLPPMNRANEVSYIPLAGLCTSGVSPQPSAPTTGTITITP